MNPIWVLWVAFWPVLGLVLGAAGVDYGVLWVVIGAGMVAGCVIAYGRSVRPRTAPEHGRP